MNTKVIRVTVIINERPHHFDKESLCPDDFRRAVEAEPDYEVWQIVGSPDPEGQLPKNDVQVVDCIPIRNGMRFRVVPPGTFGAPSGAQFLNGELGEVRKRGLTVEVAEEGGAHLVVIKDFPLPPGYTQTTTAVLIRLLPDYPRACPDMFWTDVGVLLTGGAVPRSAEHVETYLGRQWRRFSWHLNNRWHPGKDNLASYIGFIDARLARKE